MFGRRRDFSMDLFIVVVGVVVGFRTHLLEWRFVAAVGFHCDAEEWQNNQNYTQRVMFIFGIPLSHLHLSFLCLTHTHTHKRIHSFFLGLAIFHSNHLFPFEQICTSFNTAKEPKCYGFV